MWCDSRYIHLHSLSSLSLGRKRNDLHWKRSGKGVTPPPIHSIPLSRLSCSCHVGREIGFQPESLASSYSHFMTIESVVLDEEVDPSSSSEYHFQIPSQTSHVVRDTLTTPPSYQVFSEGTLSSILDSCGDYWSGTSLLPLTGASEKKIVEFGQNALISDCQVVGFAYRPLQETSRLKKMEMEGLSRKEPYYNYITTTTTTTGSGVDEIQEITTTIIPETIGLLTPTKKGVNTRQHSQDIITPRKRTSRISSKMDCVREEEGGGGGEGVGTREELCDEITKGQTFLCAASFVYPPKANMVDFVEVSERERERRFIYERI